MLSQQQLEQKMNICTNQILFNINSPQDSSLFHPTN